MLGVENVLISSGAMRKLNLPVILIGIILFCLFFGKILPLPVKTALYTLSLHIKEGLMFCLPFILFSFLFNSFSRLKNQAFLFVGVLLGTVCLSNFLVFQ